MSSTRLTDLARTVLEDAGKLEEYFRINNLPSPSFDEHAPSELPLSPEMQQVRQRAVEAAAELQDLLIGPAMQLRPVLNGTSLQAIYKYNIPSKVPLDGSISFLNLAKETGIERTNLERLLRFAMSHHRVFREPEPGIVAHTAASRLLVESPDAFAALGFMFDECYQSFAHTVESLERYDSPEPDHSGWAIANKSAVPMWEYHTLHPELGERAARAMVAFTKGFNLDTSALTRGYDWTSLNASKGLLIDLGGATGHVAFDLARENPHIRCIVQEIPEVVAKAKYTVPEDVADRVTFASHDFFNPQPITAQVYLFRQVMHNWSDEHCLKMLRALIPALRPGSKVLINDNIVPPPGVLRPMQEKAVRSMDMVMMSLFRAREREKTDWEKLFTEADPRFREVAVWQPKGSQLGLVEATWSD